MITNLMLKFGRAPAQQPTAFEPTPVTVFVGPNNSGKSKVLSEIHEYCVTGQTNAQAVILDSITFKSFAADSIERVLSEISLTPHFNEPIRPEQRLVGKRGTRMQVDNNTLKQALLNPNATLTQFCRWFLAFQTLTLDGKSRINLVNAQQAGDLQQPGHLSLQVLFSDDEARETVRRIVYDATRLYFVIDPTHLGHLRIRLSPAPPTNHRQERGIDKDAVDFHSKALLIEQTSDGIKAFTGIITEILAGDPRILLIDEPEAFLHPSLSHLLGKEIARAMTGSDKRLFVSTHSPNFVMGCIQSGAPVNIVRLTYRDGVATARLLPNAEILKLMRNPLLRSTNVISGLFYECVVVTEADTDRAFYQEVNERLLRFKPEWGVPNCLFINAQNKQTVPTILRPLRDLGIPAIGVVDIDVIKDAGSVWTNLLSSASLPDISHQPLGAMRAAIKSAFDKTGRDMKRDGGVNILGAQDREAAENLFSQLADYGIYVVPGGEIESWLKPLGASGHGPAWLVEIFEKMGEDSEATGYVVPSDEDVWRFISRLREWLANPLRKGIPM